MNFENKNEKLKTQELMPMPEIKTEVNSGYFWYTFLQKANNLDWEQLNNKNNFSKQLDKYFNENKLDENLKQKWQSVIYEINNDEILFWFSLAINNPELENTVFEDCVKHKDLEKEKAELLFQEFKSVVDEFKEKYSNVWNLLKPHLNEDIEKRNNSNEEKEIIQDCLDYFKPYKETSDIQEVNYLPTNPLIKETKGNGFVSKNVGIIISNFENSNSKTHEFLHCIINPITEKLNLSEQEKKKIIQMADEKLIIDQNYGEHPESLLNENLIRVYCELIKENKKPINLEIFKNFIINLTEKEFTKLKSDNLNFFNEMKIVNLENLKSRIKEIYNRKIKNILGEKIYNLYQNFEKEKQNNPGLTFEDYFLENFKMILE